MAEFFGRGSPKRLGISNPVTREECEKYLENKPDASKIPTHLCSGPAGLDPAITTPSAETDAHNHLLKYVQGFLNRKNDNPESIENLKTKFKDAISRLREKSEL